MINAAIRSRCQIFEVKPLTPDAVKKLLLRALNDSERGLGSYKTDVTDEALNHFAEASGGDVRSSLNALELAVTSTPPNSDGVISITLEAAEECLQQKSFAHDKDGDAHYDVLSGFQKSIRGSDVNAALHYLARLIEAGDLVSIARRLFIIAYEDIGLASPRQAPVHLRPLKRRNGRAFLKHAFHLPMPLLNFVYPQSQTPLIKRLMQPLPISVLGAQVKYLLT